MVLIIADTNNHTNNFLVLGEWPTYGINGGFGAAEKNLSVNFSNAKKKFAWVCIIIKMIVICLVIEKKSIIWKTIIKMLTFSIGSISNGFGVTEYK